MEHTNWSNSTCTATTITIFSGNDTSTFEDIKIMCFENEVLEDIKIIKEHHGCKKHRKTPIPKMHITKNIKKVYRSQLPYKIRERD
jgi:hypothetical protein